MYEFIEYEHRLAARQVLSLNSRDGVEIICRTGGLWLTEEGGPDVHLRAGERYRSQGTGRLVVEAVQTAQLQVRPKAELHASISLSRLVQSGGNMAKTVATTIHHAAAPLIGLVVRWAQARRKSSAAGAGCTCA